MTPESVPNERDPELGTESAPPGRDAFRNFAGDDATDSLVFFAGGLASSGIFLLAQTLWPVSIAALFALLVLVFVGAGPRRVQIGFARFCDGFGGGWNRERILAVMADASVGVFGAVGLALMLLLHYTLFEGLATRYFDPVWLPELFEMPFASKPFDSSAPLGLPLIVAAIPAAQSLSHAFAIALARTLPQIHTPASQAVTASIGARTLRLLFALALAGGALAIAAIFAPVAALTATLALLALFPALRWLFLRRLSGATPELIDAARLLARGLYLLVLLALAGNASL